MNTTKNKKLAKFLTRNARTNAHLYEEGKVEGDDYVVCPVSNARMLLIKSNYITSTLGMTVEEYYSKYPTVQRVSKALHRNISKGVTAVDPETGLTKHAISTIKSKETLSKVDETGVSGYAKKGQKTRATHMSKIDELGRNGYAVLASKAIIKGNNTKARKGIISENRDKFKRFKAVVLNLTNKHKKVLTAGYITGLAGTQNAHHIDHKFSIFEGYKNKVSPFVLGNIANLEMIPWEENVKKHAKSSIPLETLLADCDYTIEQSTAEFECITKLINEDVANNIPVSTWYLIERMYATGLCKK